MIYFYCVYICTDSNLPITNINLLMNECHCSLMVIGTALSRDMDIYIYIYTYFLIWYIVKEYEMIPHITFRRFQRACYYFLFFYRACILPSHGSNMQSQFFLTINSLIKLKINRKQVFSPLEVSQRSTRIRFVSDNTHSDRDTHLYVYIFCLTYTCVFLHVCGKYQHICKI